VARITFQKRQKEMKRLEKAKAKAERRFQKKLDKGNEPETPVEEMQVLTGPALLEPEA
jgi:hypothetical protein